MTIDITLFAQLLDELASYYGRKITPFIQKAWYKKLGSQMTDDQFIAAVEDAITSKDFMPTAQALLDTIKGNLEILALEEWEKCLLAASRGDREATKNLSPAGQMALRSLGGIHLLGQSEEKEHQWLQKKFVSVWKSVPADQRPMLSPAANDFTPLVEIQDLASKMSMNGKGH